MVYTSVVDVLLLLVRDGHVLLTQRHSTGPASSKTALPFDISRRTLNSYELGDSQFSVLRFVDMCELLHIHAPDVLGLAMQRAAAAAQHIYVGVRKVRHADHDGIRRWAENRY